MDYDDNDFQGQNPHLAGEGNSNFSPVLRPYALPKFDFDDNLQGQLRFDSLVENEVFLGIPSQEDTQWIEDFSRGNSEIEFSSSAPESCSISRRHNVWSEATSSESVEMLLKSVGQEERVLRETIVEESDAGTKVDSLTKKMDSKMKQDYRMDIVTHSQPASVPDEFPENCSGMNESAGDGVPHVNCALQPQEVEPSPYGSSVELDSNVISEKCGLLEAESQSDDANASSSVTGTLSNKMQEDASVSRVEIANIGSSSQKVTASTGELKEALSCGKGIDGNIMTAHPSESVTITENEPTLNGVLSHLNSGGTTEESIVHADEQNSSALGVGLTHITEMEETEFRIAGEASLSTPVESSQVADEQDPGSEVPVSEVEKGASLDCAAQIQHEKVDQPVSMLETCNAASQIGQVSVATGVGQESSDMLDASPVFCGTTMDKGEDAEAVAIQNLKETTIRSNDEVASLQVAAMDVGVEGTDSASCETLDIVPSLAASGVVADTIKNGEQKSPALGVSLKDLDNKEETVVQLVVETSAETEPGSECPVSGVENDVFHGCASQILHEMIDQSVSTVETHSVASQVEQATVLNNDGQECSEKSDVCHVLCDSTVEEGNVAGGVAFVNDKEADIQRNHEVASLDIAVLIPKESEMVTEPVSIAPVESCFDMGHKNHEDDENLAFGVDKPDQTAPSSEVHLSNDDQDSSTPARKSECDANQMPDGGGSSADLDIANCDSPTVISCAALSRVENDRQEDVKGAMTENLSLPVVTCDMDGKSISSELRGDLASMEESSFTFEASPLAGLSEGETGKGRESFPIIQACQISTVVLFVFAFRLLVTSSVPHFCLYYSVFNFFSHEFLLKIVEGTPSTFGGGQMDPKSAEGFSCASPQVPDGDLGAKGTPGGRKSRRGSGKAGKDNAKKGNHMKATTPVRLLERADNSCVPTGPPGTGQLMQFENLKSYGNVERSGTKSLGLISIATSNLPDLNTSVATSPLFQQPFTDLQQVQLRAQIFVYGSLIQGAAPDEACMISAFGQSDGGRSLWEPIWRACVERLHGLKSHANNAETPVQSRLGARDQTIKHSPLQSKIVSSPVGRTSSKSTPSPVLNPMMPLSSPLWSATTPSCDGLQSSGMARGGLLDYHQPLSPYQTPTLRNFAGHNPSWLSQPPFPNPWVASPQSSAFDVSGRLLGMPVTEPVKLTPVREPSVPASSGIQLVSPVPVAHGGGASVTGGTSLSDMNMISVSSGQQSAGPKSRRRKKAPVAEAISQLPLPSQILTESFCSLPELSKKISVSEGVGQKSLLAQSQTKSVSAPVISSIFSSSTAVTTPACFTSKSKSDKLVPALSPTSLIDQPRLEDQTAEKKVTISEETSSKVEEAREQAEDAAKHAAAAVSQYEGVWSQLDQQKKSGLISEVEAKLASAALAIAAAASVAKAAAAAAKIASNAAAQAKLMADEVLVSCGNGNSTLSNVMSHSTPGSILKGGDGSTCSSSVILAAREAARKRVEAASAASKQAENLDAIVKAAELAAEAVSQVGKLVSVGDPLSVNELVKSGPEGYWKISQASSEQGMKSDPLNRDQSNKESIEEDSNVDATEAKEGPSHKEMQSSAKESSGISLGDQMRVDDISGSVKNPEKDTKGQKGRRTSDLAKTIGVVPGSEIGSKLVVSRDEYNDASGTSKDSSMKEGCLVEVFKDGGHFKASWFLANILSLEDGKAYVCYTELQSDEGSGKLKEWVPVEGEGNRAPRIRIPHPTTSMRLEGTRKRRRAAMTDYTWSVGERVDACIHDCWREGMITEKNKNDENTLTIHFPAHEETSVVKAWHLRPTLIWKDGEWNEWSRSSGDRSAQGDTPEEKRLKMGSPVIESKGKDKTVKHTNFVESGKHEDSRLLPLSANETLFNVGKNTRDESKLDATRTMRAGLQKEGSRVIFGVPEPGKKRKFMDVSKHYVSDRSGKNSAPNESVKFPRYMMPQGSGSRGWKSSSKFDAKEKQAAESKPKALKSEKPLNVSARTLPRRDNSTTSGKSSPHEANLRESSQQSLMDLGSSNIEVAAEGPSLVSSLGLPPIAPKKVPLSTAKAERLNKGKLAPAGVKFSKAEVKDKSIPEVAEPRRSNRRIQPTSRLLEGLQSSLIPSVPHDKGHRSKGTSKGKILASI
ncbi:hypothetical protein RJ640_012863 [Escallonia rubra]|uniref:Agenet domain-containing protein n=1 Tax=Escallonia rubra TaxID=112253 RepID=A0AA88QU88_9ASTE|nr:hypothetical protein RJ640_012863 [Escallonia rubra]